MRRSLRPASPSSLPPSQLGAGGQQDTGRSPSRPQKSEINKGEQTFPWERANKGWGDRSDEEKERSFYLHRNEG